MSVRNAALGDVRCCGRPVLIAGAAKVDRTGVSGRLGNVIDPVAGYRAERTPAVRALARSMEKA